MFESKAENPPLREAIEFYKHAHNWSNRLIAGDSLLVMNSLLEKEGMAGQVQMLYFDPPYGIKYGSNFQPFVNKRDVKDGKDEDLTAEPEMVKAFRDTWELGLHSYLSYLRDRLLLARELLHESGSVFVQISDENVHHVREIMDEVFGAKNFCSQIQYLKTAGLADKLLPTVADQLLWYARDKTKVKYRTLFIEKESGDAGSGVYSWIELISGERRRMNNDELQNPKLIPPGARIFRLDNVTSQGYSETASNDIELDGVKYTCGSNRHWTAPPEGMKRLFPKRRLVPSGELDPKNWTTG